MKLNDRVWCTASAQQISDAGFPYNENCMMTMTYGFVRGIREDSLMVSYAMWTNYEEGYSPIVVCAPREWFEFADLDEDYIEESEGDLPERNRRAIDYVPG